MKLKKLASFMCAALGSLAIQNAQAADAISDGVVKVGVMTDMSGVYSALAGQGSVVAAKMAIEDIGGKLLGKPVELVSIDHLNKPDIAASKAREWFDNDKVDMITDLVTSSVGLAVQQVARDKNRITINSGAGSTALTNKNCSPTGIHWAYDTYALANGTGNAMVKDGNDSWYFVTADYAFGHSLETETANVVKANGGKVLGSVRHPLSASDFSSFLISAQSSGAKAIGLANAGADLTNAIKQAREFGINKKQKLASLLMFITDVHGLGLESAQGLYLTEGFYWDMDNETRAWSKRFFERHKKMPTMVHAGVYSSMMHYFKAIQAAGTDEAQAVMAKMRELPVKDFFARNGKLRADGRMVHDMYLMQVKAPNESKYPWDYYHIRRVIPADQAFMPLDKSECPLVKK
ncbi:amino acid/amide ABC transporter substrate-binding protein (HAAT family) [Paucimonas lemoignei]|uniref:Amino acid/amide ABC transporter substrate-binding protein (HAAT family) n=1 Tax=Paucimonas lemoignei TaxID=29443 RepID=A0A4V2UIG1_PAULE|nr:ABC transporter substrate-binding protein [Paucimonas lemoignei]TCS36060.1 amino acid/amide ABC transporter substrate-binding protein (HAAT family) [Paucimonas lemoignei]